MGSYVVTLVGGLYVKHVIARMTGVYGPFAATIGLLAYVSLIVQIFVLATEVNVVRARSLWPRAMTAELGPADLRAIDLTMRREALKANRGPVRVTDHGLIGDPLRGAQRERWTGWPSHDSMRWAACSSR